MAKKKTTPLGERVEGLLKEMSALNERAEILIEEHIDNVASRAPGIPRPTLRQISIDAHATDYSFPAALRRLLKGINGCL